jgi:flavin reductase (DIM6/NTAB) family NADH-FMN oxidoreductase RutF
MSLPATLKNLARPPPPWLPIALAGPQNLIDVHLLADGMERDVTDQLAIAALVPFSVVLPCESFTEARLSFRDRETAAELAYLRLSAPRIVTTASGPLGVCAVIGGAQRCEGTLAQGVHRLRLTLARHRSAADNFRMSPAALRRMQIFYLCPRPVVLVSVDDGTDSNLFPMDLIGPVPGNGFVLSLRNTSPSIATIQRARRVALGDVAAQDRELAYGLGKHHRQARIDWSGLPCDTIRSPRFALPLPARCPRVRECEIDCWHAIGSHTLFAGRVVSEHTRAEAPHLFHTSGMHRRYRERMSLRTPWFEAGDAPCT